MRDGLDTEINLAIADRFERQRLQLLQVVIDEDIPRAVSQRLASRLEAQQSFRAKLRGVR